MYLWYVPCLLLADEKLPPKRYVSHVMVSCKTNLYLMFHYQFLQLGQEIATDGDPLQPFSFVVMTPD